MRVERRSSETRLVRSKFGPKQIQVERRVMPRTVAKAPEFTRAVPDKTGPLAAEIENDLRNCPIRFPGKLISTGAM
jgi:hypothetical protein